MDEITLLYVVGLPLLVGAAGLLAARFAPSSLREPIAGLAVVASCIVVQGVVVAWPNIPPRQSLDILPLLVASGAVLAAVRGRLLTVATASVLAAAPAWFLLGRLPDTEPSARVFWSLGTAAALLLLWWPTLAKTSRAGAGPGVLAVVAGGAAGTALFSSSIKVAEITGGLAVCLALIAVLILWRPSETLSRGTSLAGSVALGALLVYDQHFLSTPPLELLLLIGGWATLHSLWRQPTAPWTVRRQLVVGLMAAVPVGVAVVLGFLRYQEAQQSNSYY